MTIKDNEHLDLPTPNGPMRTYVFRPAAAGKYPGLVLFSEILEIEKEAANEIWRLPES